MIGYAFCGSYCTHAASLAQLERLISTSFPRTSAGFARNLIIATRTSRGMTQRMPLSAR